MLRLKYGTQIHISFLANWFVIHEDILATLQYVMYPIPTNTENTSIPVMKVATKKVILAAFTKKGAMVENEKPPITMILNESHLRALQYS